MRRPGERSADPVVAPSADPVVRLRVDPLACDGIGICAHLAPDVVRVDSWGYPIVPAQELTDRQQRQAARAVAGCPRRALFLESRVTPPVSRQSESGGAPRVGYLTIVRDHTPAPGHQ